MKKFEVFTAPWANEGWVLDSALRDTGLKTLRHTLNVAEALHTGYHSEKPVWVFVQDRATGNFLGYALIDLYDQGSLGSVSTASIVGNVIAVEVRIGSEDDGVADALKKRSESILWEHEAKLRMQSRSKRAGQ